MILLSRAVRVYFAIEPTNLRLSFDGLTNAIRHALGYDPLSGHLFVFVNRRKNQVKLIAWTRGGFTIVHKRLERGTFTFPARVTADAKSVAIDVHELAMLLEGVDVSRAKTKPRWEPRVARWRLARVRRVLAESALQLRYPRLQPRNLAILGLDRRLLRLDEALQLGEPIFEADHPFVRSRRSSGVDRVDRLRACEEIRTPPRERVHI